MKITNTYLVVYAQQYRDNPSTELLKRSFNAPPLDDTFALVCASTRTHNSKRTELFKTFKGVSY